MLGETWNSGKGLWKADVLKTGEACMPTTPGWCMSDWKHHLSLKVF